MRGQAQTSLAATKLNPLCSSGGGAEPEPEPDGGGGGVDYSAYYSGDSVYGEKMTFFSRYFAT